VVWHGVNGELRRKREERSFLLIRLPRQTKNAQPHVVAAGRNAAIVSELALRKLHRANSAQQQTMLSDQRHRYDRTHIGAGARTLL
jgi:hypothetical protein